MSHSGSRSARSGGGSTTSRTSISVKLPTTEGHPHTTPTIQQYETDALYTTTNDGATGTPMQHLLDKDELERMYAVQIIERAWQMFRDKQMFRLLKHAVCAAEKSLSYEILRKVCPKEAEFLRDKCNQTKVRFRFGGSEFPPLIFFKVYTCTGTAGLGLKYLSGKRMIQPASEAARDACDLMGQRKFLQQVIDDCVQQESHPITSEVDVTTLKDYMQYMSLMDELPSYLGGRDNCWRKLTLEDLPRQTIFYDIVEFLYSRKLSDRLNEELPKLLVKPANQDVLNEHMDIISQIRCPTPLLTSGSSRYVVTAPQTGRRTKQARRRVEKMKRLYQQQSPSNAYTGGGTTGKGTEGPSWTQQEEGLSEDEDGEIGETWEEEADRLYEWTQELSMDEFVTTPRIATAPQLI